MGTRDYHEADPSNPVCVEEDTEEGEKCAFNQCPVPAKMGSWTTWGPPAAVCGLVCKKGAYATRTPIMQSRMRPCIEGLHGGRTCDNLLRVKDKVEERMCPTSKPCPEDCKVGSWGEWSRCSRDCDGGLTERTRIIHGPFHGGQECDNQVLKDDIRCQTKGMNYHGKQVIRTIVAGSWIECLQKCEAEDTCNYWVKFKSNNCELISEYTVGYISTDVSVEVAGPKICTHYLSREVKDCKTQRCPRCYYTSWSEWSTCGYCMYNAGNYQSRSRRKMMTSGPTEFNGITLKCEGYDYDRAACYGSFGYWVVGAVTAGLANLAICSD